MNGYYEPGQRLLIIDLAEELGTSVTPVREAIFRLVADGALEMQKVQSVTVPLLTDEQIAEVRTIRILLEGEAAAIAAKKATAKQIDNVAAINDAFFASLQSGDSRKASELNREFHLAVVAVAEMPIVMSTVEMMWARMGALIHRINLDLRASQNYGPDHEHYRVIEGLRLRDPQLAKVSIQNDIRFSRVGILTPRGGEASAAEVRPRRRRRSVRGGTQVQSFG